MNVITFEGLPAAVTELLTRIGNIEKILTEPKAKENVDEFLDIIETSKYIKKAVPTIYGMVQQKEIPVCKRGKRLYFLKAELDNWIKGGRKKTIVEIQNEAEQHLVITKKRLNYGK
jgi:predicted DNA-binding transcriptional regulator AlpA